MRKGIVLQAVELSGLGATPLDCPTALLVHRIFLVMHPAAMSSFRLFPLFNRWNRRKI